MRRIQESLLHTWLHKPGRKPLIIRGARQVGKSTLVKIFAQNERLRLVNINLEKYPELDKVFASMDSNYILNQLEALPAVGPIKDDCILFLDEIQATPSAIAALRYLYEEKPQIPIIAAGSLIEFILANHKFSMPVGRVEFLHMGPMNFKEFVDALDEKQLSEALSTFNWQRPIGAVIHKRLTDLQRIYLFTGGMPEAVAAYAATLRLSDVTPIHHSIIETYRNDFPKYSRHQRVIKLHDVFHYAARNVGRKVKYSHIRKEEQSKLVKQDLELLVMAKVVTKVIHSHANGLPLGAEMDESVFKLLFLDIGLMNTICGLDAAKLDRLSETALINEGPIAEQFIGQQLLTILPTSTSPELYYWLREGRSSNAEIDYIFPYAGEIFPIEVKAGKSGALKSLHQYMSKKKATTAIRFDLREASIQKVNIKTSETNNMATISYQLLSMPLYLISEFERLIRGTE